MKWIKKAKTSVNSKRYATPSLDRNGRQSGDSLRAAPSTNFIADSRVYGPTMTSIIRHDSRAIAACVQCRPISPRLACCPSGCLASAKQWGSSSSTSSVETLVMTFWSAALTRTGGPVNQSLYGGRMNTSTRATASGRKPSTPCCVAH